MAEAVIFDIDGTLLDSVEFHAMAWEEAFRKYSIEVSLADLRWQIGKGGDELIPVFVSSEKVDAIGEKLQRERSRIFRQKYLTLVKPFPGVRELFSRLRAGGKKVALASSATRDEVEKYKQITQIEDLVDADTSSEDAERSKPHPDIFLAAVDKLGDIERKEIVVVGDPPYDAEAATRAGLKMSGVLSGGFPEDVLREAGCIEIYRDPADLLEHYNESSLG